MTDAIKITQQRQRLGEGARQVFVAQGAANRRLVKRVLGAKLATVLAVPFVAWGWGLISGRPATLLACIEGSAGLAGLLIVGAVCVIWVYRWWRAGELADLERIGA